jgi:hypothetical protein
MVQLLLMTTLTLTVLSVFQFQPCDAFVISPKGASTTSSSNKIHSVLPFFATAATPEDSASSAPSTSQLPTPEESASALTDYMAKAHGEKLRAIADVEKKYKAEVAELTLKLKEHEQEKESATGAVKTSANSFEFPSTNKDLTEKVGNYQKFITDYIVKAQIERVKAVSTAEQALKTKYEAIIEEMKKEPSVLE